METVQVSLKISSGVTHTVVARSADLLPLVTNVQHWNKVRSSIKPGGKKEIYSASLLCFPDGDGQMWLKASKGDYEVVLKNVSHHQTVHQLVFFTADILTWWEIQLMWNERWLDIVHNSVTLRLISWTGFSHHSLITDLLLLWHVSVSSLRIRNRRLLDLLRVRMKNKVEGDLRNQRHVTATMEASRKEDEDERSRHSSASVGQDSLELQRDLLCHRPSTLLSDGDCFIFSLQIIS